MPVQKWSPHIWVAQLTDEPGLSEDLDYLRHQAEKSDFAPNMVLDLSHIDHLNSSNLSNLLRLRKSLIENSARLRLVAPSDPVWVVFLSTGLDKVFEFKTDTTTALAELQIEG